MRKTSKQRTRSKKPEYQLGIARERIEILMELAEKVLEKHPKRSQRYVELARKIGMRYNVRMTKEQKRGFCKKCNTILKPGVTSRQKTEKGAVVVRCERCGTVRKYPFKQKKK